MNQLSKEDLISYFRDNESLLVYATQYDFSKDQPANKNLKRVKPTLILLEKTDFFTNKLKTIGSFTFLWDKFFTMKEVLNNNKTKKFNYKISPISSFGRPLYFFNEKSEAISYWNSRINDHNNLLNEFKLKIDSIISMNKDLRIL
jgi:hypothetical protein